VQLTIPINEAAWRSQFARKIELLGVSSAVSKAQPHQLVRTVTHAHKRLQQMSIGCQVHGHLSLGNAAPRGPYLLCSGKKLGIVRQLPGLSS
jgi:hypothetical protein